MATVALVNYKEAYKLRWINSVAYSEFIWSLAELTL